MKIKASVYNFVFISKSYLILYFLMNFSLIICLKQNKIKNILITTNIKVLLEIIINLILKYFILYLLITIL